MERLAAEPIMTDLIATAAFRRLAGVRFLGGIDYILLPTPNGAQGNIRYTRYQHSLGVAWLSMLYASERLLDDRDRQLIVAASLLHDVGHCALSHTLEPVFFAKFGLNHHGMTEKIISGEVSIGKEVKQVLDHHSIELDELKFLLSGRDDRFDQFFSGPINFDTIEGILRSWAYAGYERRFLAPDTVVMAATRRASQSDRQVVDEFWSYKDKVYHYLIRSPRGVIADSLCQDAFQTDLAQIGPNDFLSSEKTIFAKCPTLKALVKSGLDWKKLNWIRRDSIDYQERRFFINSSSDFFSNHDLCRYRQMKQSRIILAEDIQPWAEGLETFS